MTALCVAPAVGGVKRDGRGLRTRSTAIPAWDVRSGRVSGCIFQVWKSRGSQMIRSRSWGHLPRSVSYFADETMNPFRRVVTPLPEHRDNVGAVRMRAFLVLGGALGRWAVGYTAASAHRSRSISAGSIIPWSARRGGSRQRRRVGRSASSRSSIRSCIACAADAGAARRGWRSTRRGSALAQAFADPDRDIAISFAGLVDARLHVTASGEEVWVVLGTQATDGRFVEERVRAVLFGLVLTAAEAVLWEPRADWPSGELAWFEVARLGLREEPS